MIFDGDYTMTIAGQPAVSDKTLPVINPATEQVIAQVPDASRAQLDAAVDAARAAFPAWSARPMAERQALVAAIGDCLLANKDAFSALLTAEQGRPRAGCDWEVATCVDWCRAVSTFTMPVEVREEAGRRVEIRHTPLGVVGAITPWNAPILMAIWKMAPALLAGNTLVLKPSPYTPLTTLRLGELLRDILPAGVVNIVTGGNDLGQWMTNHPGIDKIAFVGSTATGKKVMAAASASLKRVSLELGGNDAAIVLDDVDVAEIAPRLFASAFINSGQICMAVKRVLVQAPIAGALADALAAEAQKARVGGGFEPDVEYGPVQNRPQFDKVLAIIEDARAQGGTILTGGNALNRPGYFIAPTIVTGLREGSRLVDEEQFGPVLPILSFDSDEEAVTRANATRFGLGASVWSGNRARAEALAKRLEAGTVWINGHGGAAPDLPFGGFKESGIGRGMGLAGLRSYAEIRVMHGVGG